MRDIHALAPEHDHLQLHHVGLEGVRKPLHVSRRGRTVTLTVTFGLTVDLPAERKGSDLSRNAEILNELVDRTAERPVPSLEAACLAIATELLRRHPSARRSRVRGEAVLFLERGNGADHRSLEDFGILAEAQATRRSDDAAPELARSIGVDVVGMTVCPCAMETARDRLAQEYPALGAPALAGLPIVTHNQRNRTRLLLDLPPGAEVDAEAMVETVEAAQSAPTRALLKRGDEADLVVAAHRSPKFVEDVMRDLLASLPRRFPDLPDATGVRASTRSEESIHKYDVVAEHATTFGALRRSSPS